MKGYRLKSANGKDAEGEVLEKSFMNFLVASLSGDLNSPSSSKCQEVSRPACNGRLPRPWSRVFWESLFYEHVVHDYDSWLISSSLEVKLVKHGQGSQTYKNSCLL